MKKIFDWTIGSFFRTIGRTIAFLVMGGLIYYILSYNDIDFGIKNLFFDKVNASSFTSQYLGNLCYRDGANVNTCNQMSLSNDGFWTTTLNFTSSTRNQIKYIQFPAQVALSNDKRELTFQVKLMRITQDSESDISGTRTTTCYPHYIIETDNTDFEMYIQDMQCTTTGIMNSQTYDSHFSLSISYIYNQNDYSYSPCYATGQSGDNFTIKCPVTTSNVSGLKISVSTSDIDNSSYYLGVYPLWSVETETSQAITEAIGQQTQQQQQQHQEIMDSNTTEADNTGKDFINNFSNNTHGLTGIITAPLTAIQSLSSATCNPLVLPLPFTNNKTLTLPCMSTIYTNHFGTFYTMYQGIILALISYWVCIRLFTLVKGFKDPEDDKIEVVDL